MFGKKKSKLAPILEANDSENRLNATTDAMRVQILKLESKQNVFVDKIIEAKKKGLNAEAEQARALLRRTLDMKKRVEKTLMSLELAVQSRDLAVINKQFVESLGGVSREIVQSVRSTDTKRAQKDYERACYEADKQARSIDNMLARQDAVNAISVNAVMTDEYDDEIDMLVTQAEKTTSSNENPTSVSEWGSSRRSDRE